MFEYFDDYEQHFLLLELRLPFATINFLCSPLSSLLDLAEEENMKQIVQTVSLSIPHLSGAPQACQASTSTQASISSRIILSTRTSQKQSFFVFLNTNSKYKFFLLC
jgi:hypothetical protein